MPSNSIYDCPYNEGCKCAVMMCGACGWNPEVHKKRMKKILNIKEEKDETETP